MADCGIKNERGEPCVLQEGHGSSMGWKYREHQTVRGVTFTFMGAREKARPIRGNLRVD